MKNLITTTMLFFSLAASANTQVVYDFDKSILAPDTTDFIKETLIKKCSNALNNSEDGKVYLSKPEIQMSEEEQGATEYEIKAIFEVFYEPLGNDNDNSDLITLHLLRTKFTHTSYTELAQPISFTGDACK